MKKINTLNEELNRMKTLMSFDISSNSLDYLIEQEEKIYKSKGDPYEYKLEDGVWYTKGLKIKDWKSLKGNQKAIDTLNKRHPEAMSKSNTTTNKTDGSGEDKNVNKNTNVKGTNTTNKIVNDKNTGGGGKPVEDACKWFKPNKNRAIEILDGLIEKAELGEKFILNKEKKKKIQDLLVVLNKSKKEIENIDCKAGIEVICNPQNRKKIDDGIAVINEKKDDDDSKTVKNELEELLKLLEGIKKKCDEFVTNSKKETETTTDIETTDSEKTTTDTETTDSEEEVTTTDTETTDSEEEVTTTDTEEVDYSSDDPMGDQIDKGEFKDEFKKVRQDYRSNKRKYKIQNKECVKHIKGLYNVMKKLGLQGTGSSEEKLNNFKEKQQDEIIRADWCIAHYQNRLKKENLLGVGTDDKLRYIYDVLKEDMPSQVTTRKEGQKYTIYRNPKDQTGKIAVIKYIGNGQYQFSGGKLLLDTSNKNKTEFNKSYIDNIRNQLGLESSEKITIRPKGLKRLGNKTNGKFQVS